LFHVLKCFASSAILACLFYVNKLYSYVADRQTLVGDSGTFYSYPSTVKFGVPHVSTFGKVKHYHVTCHSRHREVGEWLWLYQF